MMIRDGRDKSLWRPGTVTELRGPVSYQVQLESGVIQHRHVDHLREWVPTRVTNAGPPVVTASASDHAVMSTPTPASLAETSSDVPHDNLSQRTLMQNHHTFHRRISLLLQPLSQRRRIIPIPGATVTQLTDIIEL